MKCCIWLRVCQSHLSMARSPISIPVSTRSLWRNFICEANLSSICLSSARRVLSSDWAHPCRWRRDAISLLNFNSSCYWVSQSRGLWTPASSDLYQSRRWQTIPLQLWNELWVWPQLLGHVCLFIIVVNDSNTFQTCGQLLVACHWDTLLRSLTVT